MRIACTAPLPVKRLAGNTRGRDFIVADLHGCRHLLEARLTAIGFDKKVDRLFSVGDLVDRGPLSFDTLRLIEELWFEFVIGNHEAMLLAYLYQRMSTYHVPSDFIRNGGEWFRELTKTQLQHFERVLVPLLLKAPLVIRVEDADCPYNVLHAEALGHGRSPMLQDADLADEGVVNSHETSITWGRRLIHGAAPVLRAFAEPEQLVIAEPALEPGLSLTYVGHTILPNPVLHRSHLFMDCGAYQAPDGKGYLMLVEHGNVVKHLRSVGVTL